MKNEFDSWSPKKRSPPLERSLLFWISLPATVYLPQALESAHLSALQTIFDGIARIMPSGSGWISQSPFPTKTSYLIGVFWIVYAYLSALFIKTKYYKQESLIHFSERRGIAILFPLISMCMFLVVIVISFTQEKHCLLCYNTNYITQSVLGWVFAWSLASATTATYWALLSLSSRSRA